MKEEGANPRVTIQPRKKLPVEKAKENVARQSSRQRFGKNRDE